MGKIEEHKRKKYLMVDNYTLDKVKKIKEIIGIEKIADSIMLVERDDKLPDDIILKNVVISITCIIKDGDACDLQLF